MRSFDGPLFVPAVVSLALVMSAAWFIQLGRAPIFRHMAAGCASTALALISPGSGALIGVVSSIVISGLRFPSRQGAVAAISLDLRMTRCDGVTATRRILQESPDIRVIILTTYADGESVFAALEAGARGYLTKDATAAEIQSAIRTVMTDEALLEPSVQGGCSSAPSAEQRQRRRRRERCPTV